MKGKISAILTFLIVPLNFFASEQIAFRELYFDFCNNACTLEPSVGKPFDIEYRIERDGDDEEGIDYLATITLNGKMFKPLSIAYNPIDGRLPFYQNKFFDNHRFQIFSLVSSQHVSTEYLFYFVRDGNEFHLLGEDAFPGIAYGCAGTNKSDNECFYAQVGYGQGQYVRQNYKLDGHRFVEIN